jgi:hypothetical protein
MPHPELSYDAPVADNASTGSAIENNYRHLITYVRLLDAEAEGAEWREVVRIVLRIDPDKELRRAWRAYEPDLSGARLDDRARLSPHAATLTPLIDLTAESELA